MKYEINGGAFPIVVCHLSNGEQMITENLQSFREQRERERIREQWDKIYENGKG